MAAVTSAVVAAGATVYAANKSSKAAKDASKIQSRSADESIRFQEDALFQLRDDLAPYREFGQNLIPQANALYGDGVAQSLQNDPVLQSLQDDAQRRITAQQAAVGRVGAGDTANILQDSFLRQGQSYLTQQRSDYLNALGLGQNAAAQSGFAGVNTGQNIGNTLLQQGNAQAAGIVGAQNAQNAGLQNIAGIGGSLLNYYQSKQQPQQQPQQQTQSFGNSGWGGTGGA